MKGSKKYFDKIAPEWDNIQRGFFSEQVREKAYAAAGLVADSGTTGRYRAEGCATTVTQNAGALTGVQEGKTPGAQVAADIGAGTGFITEGLVRRGLRVIAVDQSERILEEMKKKFSHQQGIHSLSHTNGINYVAGEAENLPIANEAADYVFANMLLHHVESPQKAIQEMARILKPGGKLVVTDLEEHPFEHLREEHHDRWMGFNEEDLRGWFAEAGLHSVQIDSVGERCCAQSRYRSKEANIGIFAASGQKPAFMRSHQ